VKHPDRDDLTGFVLGALEPDDSERVAAHIEGCKPCTAEIRHLAPAVGVLAESVEQLEPPPQLRERLMQVVNREAEAAAAAQPALAETSPRPQRRWLSGWVMRPATGLAAIALIAAAVGGYLVAGGSETETLPEPVTTVAATSTLPDAGGLLVVGEDDATLHVHGLPPLESKNAVYQVWVADGAMVHPSASFVPHHDGTATAAVPEAARDATAVMVTREPGPNQRTPTLPTVLNADLS
jgi:hypothetical protein